MTETRPKLNPCKICGGEKADRLLPGKDDRRVCMCYFDRAIRKTYRIINEPMTNPLLWCVSCQAKKRHFRRGTAERPFIDFAIIYPTRAKVYPLKSVVEVWGCTDCGQERVWGIKEIEGDGEGIDPELHPAGPSGPADTVPAPSD